LVNTLCIFLKGCVMKFGQALRKARLSKGLSQPGLGEKVGESQATISHLETGRRGVERDPGLVGKLEHALGLAAGELARYLPTDHIARRLVPGAEVPRPVGKGVGRADKDGGGFSLPVLGVVPAGRPLEAVEDGEYVDLVKTFGGRDGLFLLRVQGDSMSGSFIHDGDLVVVRAGRVAESGAVVVAKVDGAATVKRLVKKGNRWELHAANDRFPPIVLHPGERNDVVGRVVAVVKLF
jgi:SOS-response transcriptional repressor LexA